MARFSEKGLSESEIKEIRKKKGKASKNKGAVNERFIANKLKEWGYKTERTAQHSGKNGGDADVKGVPYLHIEVKAQEKLNIHNAYDQAIRDVSDKGSFDIPIVFHKQNNRSWKATLSLEDFMDIYSALSNEQIANIIDKIKFRRKKG